jgi:hypothetical protein
MFAIKTKGCVPISGADGADPKWRIAFAGPSDDIDFVRRTTSA